MSGKLPAKMEGVPRTDFIITRTQTSEDRLAGAIDKLAAVLGEQVIAMA